MLEEQVGKLNSIVQGLLLQNRMHATMTTPMINPQFCQRCGSMKSFGICPKCMIEEFVKAPRIAQDAPTPNPAPNPIPTVPTPQNPVSVPQNSIPVWVVVWRSRHNPSSGVEDVFRSRDSAFQAASNMDREEPGYQHDVVCFETRP